MTSKMNACDQLKKLFQEVEALRSPNQTFSDSSGHLFLKEFLNKKKLLWEEYQKQVVSLLDQWYGSTVFTDDVNFDHTGRVTYDGDINLSFNKRFKTFPSIIRCVNGKVNLEGTQIEQLDYLEVVDSLVCGKRSQLKSLRRLEEVTGTLNIINSKVRTLPSLRKAETVVVEDLKTLTSLPQLKEVAELYADGSGLEELPVLHSAGSLFLSATKIADLSSLTEVVNLTIKDQHHIHDLSGLKRVKNYLEIVRADNLKDLSQLEQVDDSFVVYNSGLERLDRLSMVGGNFILNEVESLTEMPSLKKVGGEMKLDKVGIEKYPLLETVGKGLKILNYLEQGFRHTFPSLKEIGTSFVGVSVYLSKAENLQQVIDLKNQGEITVSGGIKALP